VASSALPAAQPLLQHRQRLLAATEHAYALPEDTSGGAIGHRRRRPGAAAATTASAGPAASADAPVATATESGQASASMPARPLPKTTAWRHWRRAEEARQQGQEPPPAKRERKQYCCRICGATDHRQYYGQRYCPQSTNLTYDEWLTQAKAARSAKRASQSGHTD